MQGRIIHFLKHYEIKPCDKAQYHYLKRATLYERCAQGFEKDLLDFFYNVVRRHSGSLHHCNEEKTRVLVEDLTKKARIVNASSLDVQFKAGRAVAFNSAFLAVRLVLVIISSPL
jgi:hypothetical protein